MGALLSDKITEKHQLWRLCAGFWLHRSVVHLIVSTLSVLFVGIRFEQEFGFLRIGIIYVLSGFGGSLFYTLNVSSYVMAGATAPLFGLIGAMLSELFINWTLCTNKRAHFSTALVIAIINFLLLGKIGFEYGGMALIFGGLSTGLILGFVLLVRPQIGSIEGGGQHLLLAKASDKDKYQGYQYLLWVVALIAFIAGFVQTFVKLFKLMHSNTVGANA